MKKVRRVLLMGSIVVLATVACQGARCVPVIEVQSVLRDPCVIDDSWPPEYP